jgi:hypothetical protein
MWVYYTPTFQRMCCIHRPGRRNNVDYSLETLKALIITLEGGQGRLWERQTTFSGVGSGFKKLLIADKQ